MKFLKNIILFWTLCICASAQTLTLQPSTASPSTTSFPVLQDGTPVKLRLINALSSSKTRTGEPVDLEVVEEVHLGNIIVVVKGGAAYAKVTAAESKHEAHQGKLEITVDYLRLANGDKANLRGVADTNGSAVLISSGPLPGKDVNIPKGTEVTAYVNGGVSIDPRKFQQLGGAAIPIPAAVIASERTEFDISSDPAEAEVWVDGKLVGDSPVRVIVSNGDHVMEVRKAGFASWVSTVRAAGGQVPLAVPLGKGDNSELQSIGGLSSNAAGICNTGRCASSAGEAAKAAHAARPKPVSDDQQNPSPQR
jgi:PEGA domain-containing protein